MLPLLKALALFSTAALCELGGCYLVWVCMKNGASKYTFLLGVGVLTLYSVIQTQQVFQFGKAFATYGGVFVVGALLFGWATQGSAPKLGDWVGAGIILVGVGVMLCSK